jgi:ABC transporter substrate binding protein
MDRLATAAHGLSRRRFLQGSAALAGLGLVSGCGGVPPWAQPPKVRRIGDLEGNDAGDETQFAPFRDRLRELGYVEGENLVIERRFAHNDPTRFPALIAELEAAGVEVIVCGGIPVCLAVKEANPPIPTVAWIPASDPVFYGLVQNIVRPEGNITGIAGTPGTLLGGKQLQILHAAVPDARRIGVLAPREASGAGREPPESQGRGEPPRARSRERDRAGSQRH